MPTGPGRQQRCFAIVTPRVHRMLPDPNGRGLHGRTSGRVRGLEMRVAPQSPSGLPCPIRTNGS